MTALSEGFADEGPPCASSPITNHHSPITNQVTHVLSNFGCMSLKINKSDTYKVTQKYEVQCASF
jgi:hypothetical protein